MLSTVLSISSLLISFAILSVGHGLQNTLINLRGALENYSDLTIGVMSSCYFLGFIIGTRFTSKSIENVGQIRTFAALVSIISTISIFHILFINPLFWILLKLAYGFCISGAFVVIESWLNALSSKENRGRILSIYMIIYFLGLFVGQLFVNVDFVKSFELFGLVSIFASISLVPLILSKAKQPEEIYTEPFSLKKLYQTSPLAAFGSLINGIAAGAFWAFGALFILNSGFTVHSAALFMAVTFVGALIFQWPVGLFSDLFNRRIAIAICCLVTIISAIFIVGLTSNSSTTQLTLPLLILAIIFGGFSYTLYSLFISLANDFLKPGMFVKASATLLQANSLGAIIGPLMAALFIFIFNQNGLFYFLILNYSLIFSAALYGLFLGKTIPESTTEDFVAVPQTAASIYNLDPRFDKS